MLQGCVVTGVVVVLSALAGVWLNSISRESDPDDVRSTDGDRDEGTVLRLNWSYSDTNPRHMTQMLASLATPAVLTGTPFDQWSSSSWTFETLREQIPHVLVKRSNKQLFKYHATDQPLDAIQQFINPVDYQEVILSGPDFFKHIHDPPKGVHYYSSGGIEILQLPAPPYSEASLHQVTFDPQRGPGQVNYWFGGTNVTAHTHYDTSHNLHVVIHGMKRFLIFPPSAYHHLLLYPCLHQLYRQVQVDIATLSSQLPRPIEVNLQPGEVLYLPPYWFHHVLTVTPSISLNVWSDSATYLLMEEVYAAPIPFEEQWGEDKLMGALRLFLEVLLKKMELPIAFVRNMVFSRYESLLSRISDLQLKQLLPQVQNYCPGSAPPFSLLPPSTTQMITSRAAATSKLFQEMRREGGGGGRGGGREEMAVREINLGNYIEHLTYTLLHSQSADLLKLPLFLRECF